MKERLNIYIPEKLLKRVREHAEREERTLSAVASRALEAYINKEKRKDGNSRRSSRPA